MQPVLVVLCAAISFALAVAVRDLPSRGQSSTSPCPRCENGGVCTPSGASSTSNAAVAAEFDTGSLSVAAICSCPAPWTGTRCTIRRTAAKTTFDQDNEDATEAQEKPTTRLVSTTTFPNFASFLSEMNMPRVVLLTLALEDADDSALQDTDTIALSVYSALCPSTPCTLGLALEDIDVLDVAGSAVRVAIGSSRQERSLRKIQAILESELADDSGPLRSDVLGGVVPQQSSVELSSFPSAADRDAWRMAAKQGTATRIGTGQHVSMYRVSAVNAAPAPADSEENAESSAEVWRDPNRHWVAKRNDVKVDLIGKNAKDHESPAIACICILALVYLLITVCDVTIERVSVWLFPPEFGVCAVHEIERPSDAGVPFVVRQQFMTIRVTIAYSKPFIQQSTVAASIMYMAHSRARELTKGFGDPPPSLRFCMLGLTCNIIALTVLASAHAWQVHRSELLKQTRKSPAHIVVMTLMGVAMFCNVVFYVVMLGAVLFMTPESCLPEAQLSRSIWQEDDPPDLSAEHRLCWQLCTQYVLVSIIAFCFMAREKGKQLEEEEKGCADAQEVLDKLKKSGHHGGFGEESDSLNRQSDSREKFPSREKFTFEVKDATMSELSDSTDQFRMLHRCVTLAGYVSVLCLILREVVVDEDSRAASLRGWLLQTVSWVMVWYTIFTAAMLFCPSHFGLKFDFPEYVVPFGSSLDYIVATSEVAWVANAFQLVRRSVLLTMYTIVFILSFSVFFGENTSEGVFIMPLIPWPVVWALVMMIMSVFFKTILLCHEVIIAKVRKQQGANQTLTLESAVREVECFIGLCPMLSCTFIVALGRAQELDPMGQVQPFQLTAMNLTAQTMLLQMILAVVEATVRRLVFVDYGEVKAEQRAERKEGILGLGRGVGFERSDETEVHYPDRSPLPSLNDLREEDHPAMGSRDHQHIEARSISRGTEADEFPQEYEHHYMGSRCLKMLGTIAQASFLLTQCVAIVVLIVGTVLIDSPYHERMEDSKYEDWRSDFLPLLPRNAPMSSALECTLWFVGIYYLCNAILTTSMSLYQFGHRGARWFYKVFDRAKELCETVPNVCVLYITARIQASLLHGVNSAPPRWMQMHMYVIWISFSIELVSSVLSPGVSAEFMKIHQDPRVVAIIRGCFFLVEAIAALGMYEGIFVLVVGMMMMKPEYVVLPDGSTGIPWRGPGAEPALPAVTWNMWALTLLVFVPSLLHKITQAIITVKKLQMGSTMNMRKKLWAQVQLTGSWLRRNAVLHHSLILVRETVMSAIILGILFIPMVELRSLSMKEGGSSKESLLVSLLNAGFFVASLLLGLKTFLVFFMGLLEKPLECELFPGAVEAMEDVAPQDEEEEQHAVEYQNFSNSWQSEVAGKTPRALQLSRLVRRLAVFITACEFVSSVFLFAGMNHLSKDWGHDVLGKETFYFGPALMFCSYVLVYYLTIFMLLFGRHSIFLDQLYDTVIMCPLLIILAVGARLRSLEVAGSEGVVPSWMRSITNMCSYCIVTEMLMVLILLPVPMKRFWHTGSFKSTNTMADYLLDHNENPERVLAMIGKQLIRVTLYGCIGCMVVSLFWLTEDQCVPDDK